MSETHELVRLTNQRQLTRDLRERIKKELEGRALPALVEASLNAIENRDAGWQTDLYGLVAKLPAQFSHLLNDFVSALSKLRLYETEEKIRQERIAERKEQKKQLKRKEQTDAPSQPAR